MVRTRITICLFFIFLFPHARAQTKLSATLQQYNESQKRLLVKNISRFLFVVSQGQWDLDSTVLFVCKNYGIDQQLPYDETINSGRGSMEIKLLAGNQVSETIQYAGKVKGEEQLRVLLELAVYYLHRPGNKPEHLDSAARFIDAAKKIAVNANPAKWIPECDALLVEYYQQTGEPQKGQEYMDRVLRAVKADPARLAIAYHQQALRLPFNDTSRLVWLNKAYANFQQLGLNEHAIEVLSDVVTTYFTFDWKTAEQKLNEVLQLEKESGYRHYMDTYFVISYLRSNSADYFGSLAYADSSLNEIKATGDSTIYSLVCMRMGAMYDGLGEWEQALTWLGKGMERRKREPRLFWKDNLEYMFFPMLKLNRTAEYRDSLESIYKEFPPATKIDSIYYLLYQGRVLEELGDVDEAGKRFNRVEHLVAEVPALYRYGNLVTGLEAVAWYHYNKKNFKHARELLKKGIDLFGDRKVISELAGQYELMYKLDSVEGNYQKAFQNHLRYVYFRDTIMNISQRFRSHELNVRYASEKKDQDIRILTQQGVIDQSSLRQARQTRNLILGGSVLLLVIIGLLYNQYRTKQKNADLIAQKNATLVQLLDEKEWLLREVHHRVKNNLQTIVSLLELQAEYLDKDALEAVQASQNRIYATSLLHQKLYQFDKVSSVNMRSYLPELTQHLQEAFAIKDRIRFVLDIAPIELDVSQAVPVGLIVNETVTNSIRYAFNGMADNATISIQFTKGTDGMLQLTIADNGRGLPHGSEMKVSGLGLKLVKGLAEDIDGHAQIESIEGTRIIIRFKPRDPLTLTMDEARLQK
ncbi:sensor histidine kinase [Flavihumibacter solisilvae]|uniref:histidine kinase n=1 Tax=Flavihumibacter solisilvae TaxID=1349421 RepID=A0A0C1IML7_9BACT|nr:sensor histidine kinase [Flavihumibacter solisilvae]KIC95475.1 hypothetical protein OI18_06235 [Flavihumibacter solisilvae]